MISSLILLTAVLLGPTSQEAGQDALSFDPKNLAVAEAGQWDGLFNGRELVAEKLPEGIIPLMDSCRRAYVERDYPAALGSYFELLELQPEFPPALLELGTVYFRLRRYGDTIVCLERFLALAPGQAWRTQVLAHSYYSLGNYDSARAHYEQVIAVIPTSVEAVRGLALTYYRLGESERALELLERVVELDSKHAEALMWRAQILFEEERSTEALAAATRASNLDRFHPRPWYLLWQINLDLGDTKAAAAAQREWKRVDVLAQEVRSLKGQLLYRPTDYGLAMRLATMQQQLGDSSGVRAAFNQAVNCRPEDVTELSLRLHVLDVLFEMEDIAGAAEAAEALARSCKEEPEAWKRLETYFARIGNAEMQVRAGELYLRLSRE